MLSGARLRARANFSVVGCTLEVALYRADF